MKKLLTLPLPLALLLFLLLTIVPDRATSQVVQKPDAVPHRAPDSLRLPLEFEANQGQASAQYQFVAHGPDYALGISPSEIALSLHRPLGTGNAQLVPAAFHPDPASPESSTQRLQIYLRLAGANANAAVSGLDRKPGMSNYFIGKDPANWHTSVPHFARVQMAGVYPGVDLLFYGNPEQLSTTSASHPALIHRSSRSSPAARYRVRSTLMGIS